MQRSPQAILTAALLSTCMVSAPAHADEVDNCAVAKSHAWLGQEIYGIQAYNDEALIIRIEDFGTGERLQRFMDITEPMQVSGIIAKFS